MFEFSVITESIEYLGFAANRNFLDSRLFFPRAACLKYNPVRMTPFLTAMRVHNRHFITSAYGGDACSGKISLLRKNQ